MSEVEFKGTTLAGAPIIGLFCRHEFLKAAADLTAEEKAAATPIILPTVGGGAGGGGDDGGGEPPEPQYYMAVRDAIQTIADKTITVDVDSVAVEVTTPCAEFTEILKDSAKQYIGSVDKCGGKLYVGDQIRYQAGITSFETYTITDKAHYEVSPEWLWGCNFTPFEQRRCEKC